MVLESFSEDIEKHLNNLEENMIQNYRFLSKLNKLIKIKKYSICLGNYLKNQYEVYLVSKI